MNERELGIVGIRFILSSFLVLALCCSLASFLSFLGSPSLRNLEDLREDLGDGDISYLKNFIVQPTAKFQNPVNVKFHHKDLFSKI